MVNVQEPSLAIGAQGHGVSSLHKQLGQLGYEIPANERRGAHYGPGTEKAVRAFQGSQDLGDTGIVDTATGAALSELILRDAYVVSGKVRSADGFAVEGLTVELIDVFVGGHQMLAKVKVGVGGKYRFDPILISDKYLSEHHKNSADLQILVISGQHRLAESAIFFNAAKQITCALEIPKGSVGLPSEYETLLASLAATYAGEPAALKAASPADIAYLARKAGYPIHAVTYALAAAGLAERTATASLAGDTKEPPSDGLPPAFYYALFRAGVPTELSGLFQTIPTKVEAIWRQAIRQNIIPHSFQAEIPTALEKYTLLSADQLERSPPFIGVSSLREMVLANLIDPNQQSAFIQLIARHGNNAEGFWRATEAAFGTSVAANLSFIGRLYALTLNNVPLVSSLLKAEAADPPTKLIDLAARGYHEPSKWSALIGEAIPPHITADEGSDRREVYAERLAGRIRTSYPTAAIADKLRHGALRLGIDTETAKDTIAFLTQHQESFRIGRHPIDAFVSTLSPNAAPSAAVIAQIKRLHRCYQLTKHDAHIEVLLATKLDSAYAISQLSEASLVRRLAIPLGGEETARALHRRAKQIHGPILHAAVRHIQGRTSPSIGRNYTAGIARSLAPSAVARSPNDGISAVLPTVTIENLFGSLDYCNCEDCSSILSPAAYLVDLLNLLDADQPSPGYQDPQDVLFGRRPDIQYLNLECANTNTALPYIDIVNETLEYYVANDLTLDGFQGFNTDPSIASAELIANPQNVNEAAYAVLQSTAFPPPLPFNRSLLLLRAQLQGLGVTLPDAMITLRNSELLNNPVNPLSYGWTDILLEQIGLSREEHNLLIEDDTKIELGDLYGLPNETALATLQGLSLQDLSRRLAVSYENIAAIVQTAFVNPNLALLAKLEPLGVPFSTILALSAKAISPDQFNVALPEDLDLSQYGPGTPADWVLDPVRFADIMRIIVLLPTGPASVDPQQQCSGLAWKLGYSNPDPSANRLSATGYLRLIRFLRLWLKLSDQFGVVADASSIAQTDQVLAALYPNDQLPIDSGNESLDANDRAMLDKGFTELLQRLGFFIQISKLLGIAPGQSLGQLLACWSSIGTFGANSLYSQLFLTPARLLQDQETQTATLSGRFFPGEIINTTINGVLLGYSVSANQSTPAALALDVAEVINSENVAQDPATGLILDERFFATAANGVVAIQAGFTVACATSGPAEGYTLGPATPIRASLIVGPAALVLGTKLTTTINTQPIDYIVSEADLAAAGPAQSVAAAIADLIGSTSLPDVYSGLPLNAIVGASSSTGDGSVTIIAVNAGSPFTLGCAILPVTGTYQAGSFDPGGSITITFTGMSTDTGQLAFQIDTLSGAHISETVPIPMGDQDAVANAVATTLGPLLTFEFASVRCVENVVTVKGAFLHGASVTGTLTGADGLTWAMTPPTLGSWVCTVGSSISVEATLETIVNGVTVTSTVLPDEFDDPAALASAIAQDIMNDAAANAIVTAVASGATILVTERVAAPDWLSVTCQLLIPGSISAAGPSQPIFTLAIDGQMQVDDEINLFFNGAMISYAVTRFDVDQSAFLGGDVAPWIDSTNLINFINNSTVIDPQSGQPISVAFSATQDQTPRSTNIILFVNIGHAYVPSITATFTIAPTGITDDTGNPVITATQAVQVVTVTDGIPAGTELTVTLDGVDLTYTTVQGDDVAAIETAIANLVNTSNVWIWIEQDGGFQALPSLFHATADNGGVTISSLTYGIAFTVTVGIASTGTYVAGRRRNPFVDDGYGNYLADPTGVYTLFGYEPLICAGCNLTGAEFNEIASFLGYDVLTALKLEYISDLFRHGWLAHTLGISVVEFLALIEATELQPFAMIAPGAANPVEPAAVQLITRLQAMTAAGLEPVQVLYLLWNQDLTGSAAPADSDILGLAFTLRADCAAVEAQFTLKSDPNGSIALALMTLVYGAPAANYFFGILTISASNQTTAAFFATYPELKIFFAEFSGQPPQVWQPALLAAVLPVLKETRKRQQALSAISAAVGVDSSFASSLLQSASVLHADENTTEPAIIDLTALESQGLFTQFFFDNTPKAIADLSIASGPPYLFMPLQLLTLGGKLTSGDVLSTAMNGITVTYQVGASDKSLDDLALDLAARLNGTTLIDPASDLPLNQLFTAFATGSTIVIVGADATGANPAPIFSAAPSEGASETYVASTKSGPIALRWSGYLDVPQDGVYSLGITLDAGATVKVSIGGTDLAGTQTDETWRGNQALGLTAGVLTPFTVTVTSITTSVLTQWQSAGVGWQLIPGSFLYSDALVARLRRSYVRFLKATSLATTLLLSANEIAWLARAEGASWLDRLADTPTSGDGTRLTSILDILLDYARVKTALAPGSDRLMAILQAPPTAQTTVLLCALTGWNTTSVNSLLTRFFGSIDPTPLTKVESLARVFDAYALVKTCRVSAATLISTITNAPSAGAVSSLQSALRAAYAAPDWQTVIQPINDTLRIEQRDAMVAYILKRFADPDADPTTADIDSADRLFEYFLIDVETQPAVQTSRLGLALSSVQLFIERIIRGLEPLATSADLQVDTTYGNTPLAQWTWMKRYRVWQANREIFLWPENWLYPELRDDASNLFQTMMASLQQTDITDDAASEAYLDYLSGLEEIAKLEPCGIYQDGDHNSETLHVVARSAGTSGKYYYRQYKGAGWYPMVPIAGSWTPWSQLSTDCEDVPITPVIWNNRLFIFWLKAVKTAAPKPPGAPTTDGEVGMLKYSDFQNNAAGGVAAQTSNSVNVFGTLCWSEFHNGKWQPQKTSDPNNPTLIGTFDSAGTNSFDSARQTLSLMPLSLSPDGADPSAQPLCMQIFSHTYSDHIPNFCGFVLHNSHSVPIPLEYVSTPRIDVTPILGVFPENGIYIGGNQSPGQLYISYFDSGIQLPLFTYTWQPRIILPPYASEPDLGPFFYEDRKRVFLVQSAVQILDPIYHFPDQFGILRAPAARSGGVLPFESLKTSGPAGPHRKTPLGRRQA